MSKYFGAFQILFEGVTQFVNKKLILLEKIILKTNVLNPNEIKFKSPF